MLKYIINKIKSKYVFYYYHFKKRNVYYSDECIESIFRKRNEQIILERIKRKKCVNVAFFCMAVPLFRYETIVRHMLMDPYFNPIIFIAPRNGDWLNRLKEIKDIEQYCKKKSFPYVSLKNNILNIGQDITKYDIDIAFYSQPYTAVCCQEYYYDKLRNALLCYIPYGYLISYMKHNYASILNLIAWKNYLPTDVSVKIALEFNPDYKTVFFEGYPGYDMYNQCKPYEWKCKNLKRVIWAPHHSVQSSGWLHLSCFLDIYDDMLKLACKYKKQIQFVFKPHPHLYTALLSVWGREKTDSYYELWRTMDNTTIENGDSYPIFKSSDALIHDCGSFLLDYMYCQKPCLYVSLTGKLNVDTAQDGIDAYEAHYHAYIKKDIDDFIENVVIKGIDTMKSQRMTVLNKYILPNHGNSATENILNDIKSSLIR